MADYQVKSWPPRPELGQNPKDLCGIKKVPLHLVPASSIIYEALAMLEGAQASGYGPYNWRGNKVVASIYIDACRRHLDAWFDSSEECSERGVPHLGNAKACLGILIDALESGNLLDDRPAPGPAAQLQEKFKPLVASLIEAGEEQPDASVDSSEV
jgi:hypothetical protein